MGALLETVSFKDLNQWSVHLLTNNDLLFTTKYPIVLFKDFTKKGIIEKVNIEDDKKYKILGVRSYGLGVYLNREVFGKTLKMKTYQKAKKNHLFWCKVDTKNGAFGIVTDTLEGGLGSSNMSIAELDIEKINTTYLQLFFKSKKFNTYMDTLVVGTTNRKYIKFNDLLNEVKIPLPPLEIQKNIVYGVIKYEKLLTNLKIEFKTLLDKFKNKIFNSLDEKENSVLSFIPFNKVHNWSVQNLSKNDFNYNENYNLEKIGNLLRRDKTQVIIKDEIQYTRVTIRTKNNGVCIRNTEIGKNIGTKKQFIIKEGQFLLSKIDARNGAFGIATKELDGAIITADFFAYDINEEKINPYFLSLITTTKQFLQFSQNSSTGTTNRQRLNESLFLNIEIPLPSLEEQKDLVKDLENNLQLQKQAEQNRVLSLKEFEKGIFANA